VHAVEGAGEDEQVVGTELVEAGVEIAVVDQAAGFVDDEEGEDDPGGFLVMLLLLMKGRVWTDMMDCALFLQMRLRLILYHRTISGTEALPAVL